MDAFQTAQREVEKLAKKLEAAKKKVRDRKHSKNLSFVVQKAHI